MKEAVAKYVKPENGWEYVETISGFGNRKRLSCGYVWKKVGTNLSVICFNRSRYSNIGEVEGCVVVKELKAIHSFVSDFGMSNFTLPINLTDTVEQWR